MAAPDKILIVDDEPDALENCRRILSGHRYDCLLETDPNQALAAIERERPKVLLTDVRMPGLDGIGLLKAAKRIDPAIQVVLLTAYASIKTAVASMRHGAFDYLTKPFTGEELRAVIRRALGEESDDSTAYEGESASPSTGKAKRATARNEEEVLLGISAAMQAVRELIERVAATEATVLICGEHGTGKECAARTIHARSARQSKPFVAVDCLTSDESALEVQLFGTQQSASRVGVGSQSGLLELAHGGTLFLDEVGGLSLQLQSKLLRALKERRGRRVGGNRFVEIDTRVIAGSPQDLPRACSRGEFRDDFYQYLNIVPIVLPPLRDRVEDIEALAQSYLQTSLRERGRRPLQAGFTSEALALLRRYAWPGNVRELQNIIERAVVLADGPLIDLTHLPDRLRSS
jgi:two-component system response regulator AtoC